MTALKDILLTRIARTGPLTIADYMTECLWNPDHGYYATRNPLGAEGDFTTAPDISQMFGELIGLALAQGWMDQGRPARFTLAELGPGRGTLMADILRAAAAAPGFLDAADIHLVEASEPLRALQRTAVPNARFHDSVATLPDQPLFLVANEFFDALPIRQFVRAPGGWSERMVGAKDGQLIFGQAAATPLEDLDDRLERTKAGDMIETTIGLAGIVESIGTRVATHGGAALIVDYGDWSATGNTFQALKSHAKVDPLADPGAADVTAHVDFAAIAEASPSAVSQMTTQGVFLEQLGITHRAQVLARGLTGDALDMHIAAHRRLTHPDEMGTLFKVIGLHPETAAPLPGLTP